MNTAQLKKLARLCLSHMPAKESPGQQLRWLMDWRNANADKLYQAGIPDGQARNFDPWEWAKK